MILGDLIRGFGKIEMFSRVIFIMTGALKNNNNTKTYQLILLIFCMYFVHGFDDILPKFGTKRQNRFQKHPFRNYYFK